MNTLQDEDISLCLDLDDAACSPGNTSTLIDLWSKLQGIAVEASQAPTPNLFAFAGTCLIFAVIMENPKPAIGPELTKGGNKTKSEAGMESRSRHEPHWNDTSATDTYPEPIFTMAQDSNHQESNDGQMHLSDDSNTAVAGEPSFNFHETAASNGEASYNDHYGTPWQSYHGLGYSEPTTSFADNQNYSDIAYNNPSLSQKAIGFTYVISSGQENIPTGEGNIGIILTPEARKKGFAEQAGKLVLRLLFDEICLHRVQTSVLDCADKDWVIMLFIQLGFVHEGLRRRSVFCPNEGPKGEWKDVTHLAILATDWVMRNHMRPAPKNLWDEMFLRHAREREELLRWEQKLKRTSSMETVRVQDNLPLETGSVAGSSIDVGSRAVTPSVHTEEGSRASSHAPTDCELERSYHSWDEDWESDEAGGHFQRPFSHIPRSTPIVAGIASFSSSSSSSSVVHTHSSPESVPRSISPSNSHWEMLETSSVSSSGFESLEDPGED